MVGSYILDHYIIFGVAYVISTFALIIGYLIAKKRRFLREGLYLSKVSEQEFNQVSKSLTRYELEKLKRTKEYQYYLKAKNIYPSNK